MIFASCGIDGEAKVGEPRFQEAQNFAMLRRDTFTAPLRSGAAIEHKRRSAANCKPT
jgi:hypothetical protein